MSSNNALISSDFTGFKAPLYIGWELTHLCNAACLHCYSNSGKGASSKEDLSTEECFSVIDQLADAGLMVLAFSGGEPLIRDDWHQLASHAKSRGLVVNIGTNGSLIDESKADKVKKIGVNSVTVSIDSHRAALHDKFRKFEGLFEHAIRAVKLLVERDIRVIVGFTPTKLNWKDGLSIVQLAHDLGASAVNLSQYVPAGRGPVSITLDPDELREILQEWIGLRKQYRGKMEIIWHDCRVSILAPPDEKRDYLGCGAGRLVARILPDGVITPCVFLPTPIGSFRENTFQEIWRGSKLLRQFRDRSEHTGNCRDCEHLNVCGGCRAVAHAYSKGDPLSGDPHCWIKPEPGVRAAAIGKKGENKAFGGVDFE